MLKMVMIVYNEALDLEIMEILEFCQARNYTKHMGVYGRGGSSGTHLGNDIWPGKNNILYVACPQDQARMILSQVKKLREKFSREGIKGFILPLEETT